MQIFKVSDNSEKENKESKIDEDKEKENIEILNPVTKNTSDK